MNLPSKKLYDVITQLFRSLYKVRSKYFDLKELVGSLEARLENSYPKDDLKLQRL